MHRVELGREVSPRRSVHGAANGYRTDQPAAAGLLSAEATGASPSEQLTALETPSTIADPIARAAAGAFSARNPRGSQAR